MSEIKVNEAHTKQSSDIIESFLIELYGVGGYTSIIKVMMKHCGQTEKEISSNYDLFAELIIGIFGDLGNTKILEPIRSKINEIKNYQTVDSKKKDQDSIKILIAEDDPHILKLYKEWLRFDNRKIITSENGMKCLEIYQKEFSHQKENCFDIVILDQKMPIMSGLETARMILKINPKQRIIFASAYIEKTLLESLKNLNKAIEVIQKPFSIEQLDDMISQTSIYKKLERIKVSDSDEFISEKASYALNLIKN